MTHVDVQPIVDWLVDGARSGSRSEDVLAELCEQMARAGIPLWRVAVFVTTLHPDVMGRRFTWQPGAAVETMEAHFEIMERDEYRVSPVVVVMASRKPFRCRFRDGDPCDDFEILQDLKRNGATDYVAHPLLFTDGTVHVATWSTRAPGGFSPEQLLQIESVIAPLARVAEIRAWRRTAGNLLGTYVGPKTAERVLAGRVRRGHVESLRAAIWLSDMRGFTALSGKMPPTALIDLLNRYFECQVPLIHESGGEVLKFMGDGLLAIFPITSDDETDRVCRTALAAARAAQTAIDGLDLAGHSSATRFGLALHVGEVMYGNIGAGNRLDFTCIGPAINLAARLEKLAAKLERTIVASADFTRATPGEWDDLGCHAIAGFDEMPSVFGLRD
jgi:adenylate cyclase